MLKKLWFSLPFTGEAKPTVAVVPMGGVISSDTRPGRGLNLVAMEKTLERVFTGGPYKAVILAINSPGGSPTQSRMLHDRIRALSKEHKVPVLSYIEDVGASGGYMIALSGDEIFADPYAIVGSIGVISAGFGFPEAIDKLGVERRVYTAGENKSQLDPFRPEDPEQVARLSEILSKLHTLFIEMVKRRRGARLKGEEKDVFSGQFWVAGDAVELGLIDGTGDLRALLQARFGKEVKLKRFDADRRPGILKLLGASHIPSQIVDPDAMIAAMEERAVWARYGQ